MKTNAFVAMFVVLVALTGCSSLTDIQATKPFTLGDTDLTVAAPSGLVLVHWDVYPPRTLAEFNLPENANGGTPAYPDIYVEKLNAEDSGTSLDDYMRRVASEHPYGEVSGSPKEIRIDGIRAFSFLAESQAIADFADGRSAIALTSHHEMAFWRHGSIYRCVLETAPDIDPKYVGVYENFCSTIRFLK